MAKEDGVAALADAWAASLPPSRDLVCFVSLFASSEPRDPGIKEIGSKLPENARRPVAVAPRP